MISILQLPEEEVAAVEFIEEADVTVDGIDIVLEAMDQPERHMHDLAATIELRNAGDADACGKEIRSGGKGIDGRRSPHGISNHIDAVVINWKITDQRIDQGQCGI